MVGMNSDYDGAWKDLLHGHLREVLECFFPAVEAAIDWRHAPVFLEQELRQLALTGEAAENRVDILVEVRTLDGAARTLYLHIEVQSFAEKEFAGRLYACFQGLCRSTGRDIVTLAILADLQPDWKPQEYHHERLGCEVTFRFPVCKLLEKLPELEKQTTLPALAAVAQIEALRTSANPDKRMAARWRLTRRLLESGKTREEVRTAFRLLAWMMKLPEPQTLQYRARFVEYENMNATAYMTDIEELWLREGIEKGREEGIEQGREAGEWIGKIVLLEQLMGRKPTSRKALENESIPSLKRKFKALEGQYRSATR